MRSSFQIDLKTTSGSICFHKAVQELINKNAGKTPAELIKRIESKGRKLTPVQKRIFIEICEGV